MPDNSEWEAQHRLDARIDELEDQHRDTYTEPKELVIWRRNLFYATDDCDWLDVWEDDCVHPKGWHDIPYRVIKRRLRLDFETIRRRPDGEPGTDWTPMNAAEIEDVKACWLGDHIRWLIDHSKVEDDA